MSENDGRGRYSSPKIKFDRDYFTKVSAKLTPNKMVDKNISKKDVQPFQLPSKEEINSDIISGITDGIIEMTKTFDCSPIEANLKLMNNSLYINLGQKHGLRNRQIGIIKKNYQSGLKSNLDTTVLFISEINKNRSKLVPLNDKVKISELDRMKIQFIE